MLDIPREIQPPTVPSLNSYPFQCPVLPPDNRQVTGMAKAAPALPATHNLVHSAETKHHARKKPINSIFHGDREEKKVTKTEH